MKKAGLCVLMALIAVVVPLCALTQPVKTRGGLGSGVPGTHCQGPPLRLCNRLLYRDLYECLQVALRSLLIE